MFLHTSSIARLDLLVQILPRVDLTIVQFCDQCRECRVVFVWAGSDMFDQTGFDVLPNIISRESFDNFWEKFSNMHRSFYDSDKLDIFCSGRTQAMRVYFPSWVLCKTIFFSFVLLDYLQPGGSKKATWQVLTCLFKLKVNNLATRFSTEVLLQRFRLLLSVRKSEAVVCVPSKILAGERVSWWY